MSSWKRLTFFPLLVAVGAVGCSSSTEPEDAGTTRDAGPVVADTGVITPDSGFPDAGEDRDAGPAQPDSGSCQLEEQPDLTPSPSCGASWTVTLKGDVQDVNGQAVENALAQICLRLEGGRFICLRPAFTCSDGHFELLIGENERCVERGAMRFAPREGNLANTYCHVQFGAAEIELAEPAVMYATSPATTLPPIGDLNTERGVVFPGGLEVDVTPSEIFQPYEELAARKLAPSDPRPCFLPANPAMEGVWAFSPEADITGDGFPLRIPNSTNLPAGTEVRLYVLGGLECHLADDTLVEEGNWEEFGRGTVTPDGTMITGDNLPCFNWVGYSRL